MTSSENVVEMRIELKKDTVLFALVSEYADWEPALLTATLHWSFCMVV